MVKSKKILYAKRFEGEPKLTNFELVEEELPALEEGGYCSLEYLCETQYLSVDPYLRLSMARRKVGATMLGTQVAKIIESRNAQFPIGALVIGNFGWRTHAVVGNTIYDCCSGCPPEPILLPDLGELCPSYFLGSLGMPGNTAYFGFLEICQPKKGETVVITGAAGAVGNHVGQIAKIKGCKVIGFAGSNEKCNWLKNDLGFDHAINYKADDINKALKKAAPGGVDCFFDNVGGELSSIIMSHMNSLGRLAICGAIANYNSETSKAPTVSFVQLDMIGKQLKIEGFVVSRWFSRWMEGILQNATWVKEGKLKIRESVTEGFENTPQAFLNLLKGENIGKAIIKC